MADQAEPQGLNPDYVPPEFAPETEREHQARNVGFSDGYHEGRNDLLGALARHHDWALKAVEKAKAEHTAEVAAAASGNPPQA